jgi:hypothetical protein
VISFLLDSIANIGLWIVYAIETAVNAITTSIAAVFAAVIAILPSMPSVPTFTGSPWLGWLNWVYPVGSVLSAAAVLLALYVTVLALRQVLRWGGYLG